MITKDHCITIRLFSNLDLTDPRLAEIALSDKKFSSKEYGKYYDDLKAEAPIYTQAAYDLIDYFDKFQNGLLKPERCNNAEPYTDVYDSSQLMEYTRWLSSSDGHSFSKRLKA